MSGRRLLQRAAMERDGARLVAARRGQTAVEPPERRETACRHSVAKSVRGPAKRGRGLIEIVLQQPGFGEHRPRGELVVARQCGRAQGRAENLHGFGAAAAFERGPGTREECLQG